MEENKETVVEETTQEETTQEPQQEQVEEQKPELDLSKFESADDPEVIKVDLTQLPPTQEDEQTVDTTETEDVKEEIVEEATVTEESTEETTEESTVDEGEVNVETTEEIIDLPENIQKLMEFMDETGGDLGDYVKLNTKTEDMDDSEILQDYYKQTKPHLNNEEISFLLEDRFSYDEDSDDERSIKRKKLALKEQVAEAKSHLDGQKSKYYEEIKAGSKLTGEQQEAVEFFNKYNAQEQEEMSIVKNQQSTFKDKTNKLFNKDFNGFEFDVGDKKMTYNIQNTSDVRDTQIDINNFVGKFLNDQNMMEDAAGYHKGLFTAMNPDAIAKHFYEQGKTDAVKQTIAESKNINTSRESHKVYEGEGGLKFTVLGDDSSDMKLRIKKRN
jgi:hypothetical protein